jgi:hypothetical protein
VFLPAAKRAGGAEKEIALQQKTARCFFGSGAIHDERHYGKVTKRLRDLSAMSCDKNS